MQDGDVSGAVRLLTSEEAILPPRAETTEVLRAKHPVGVPVTMPPPPAPGPDHIHAPLISISETRAAITGFPNGSASGSDGFRPEYSKELKATLRGVDETQSCELLSNIGDIMLAGNVLEKTRTILYGANLFAFRKQDGRIRPIAVGMALRLLVSRVVSRGLNPLAEYAPTATWLCYERGSHAARYFLESNRNCLTPKAFAKLDVKNAFNSLDRTKLLKAVSDKAPEYLRLLHQMYGAPTALLARTDVIASERGFQQADPLCPVGHCVATHDAHQDLKSELVLGYLDDDVIAGEVADVMEDILELRQKCKELGLELSP